MAPSWNRILSPRLTVSLSLTLLSLTLVAGANAQIRINEILPNPLGSDTGTEWVEIVNVGGVAVDLTGWAIDDAATFDEVAVRARIPEDFDGTSGCSIDPIIGPGEFRIVKGTSTSPWINNSGDDIYLISDRTLTPTVVHQVTYGASIENMGWAAIPDGSSNFAWRALTYCDSNGGGGDSTPPAAVTDLLAAVGGFPGEVLLTWTATGDDSITGTASEYRFKVSDAPINPGNFGSALDLEFWINEPLPNVAGTAESLMVFGLNPDSSYHFALTVIDDDSNESGVSNSANTSPLAGALLDPDLGLNVYYGNLHSHTGYSDGQLTPTAAYDYARNTAPTPLDFMAVTDHNHAGAGMALASYALGLSEAAAANSDGNFVAIYGQEWGFASSGHVNIFEAPTLFGWETNNYDVFVAEGNYPNLYSAILANPPASYPIVASWCHPGSGNFDDYILTTDGQAVVHLITLVNGPAISTATDESDIGNTNFDAVFGEALRKGYRVSPVADQDNHNATWGASSESRTAVLSTELTKSAILTALSEGRNYATMDHNADILFSADGHPMGEAFLAASGIRIALKVSDPDTGSSIAQIELFRGVTTLTAPVRIAYADNNSEFNWRELETFSPGTEVIYYLKVRQTSGRSMWTGPVYVTYDPAALISVSGPAATKGLSLAGPFPNPASGSTTIRFTLPTASSRTRVEVFNLSGRLVRTLADRAFAAGEHRVTWDGQSDGGTDLGTGVYFIRVDSGEESASRKVVHIR